MIISSRLIFLVIVITIISFFFFQREHFLIALLLLELISIVLVLRIPMFKISFGLTSTPLILVLLTMRACEASVGLGVIVCLVRSHGNDLLQSIRSSRL